MDFIFYSVASFQGHSQKHVANLSGNGGKAMIHYHHIIIQVYMYMYTVELIPHNRHICVQSCEYLTPIQDNSSLSQVYVIGVTVNYCLVWMLSVHSSACVGCY